MPDLGPVVMPDHGVPSHAGCRCVRGWIRLRCDGMMAATVVGCALSAWVAVRQICELVAVPRILNRCVRRTVLHDRVHFQEYVAGFSPVLPVDHGWSMLRFIHRLGG